jgi:nucleotide-binding universal stress UspA family protein
MSGMANPPSILCPVDFSEPSRAALSYAAAIADHFGARLTVITVDDPLLAEVAATTGLVPSLAGETENELRRFVGDTLAQPAAGPKTLAFRVTIGKPAAEILHTAQDLGADLIVMSSHGRSGVRKMFFGSTTERVLRETTVPVLVTPEGERVLSLSDLSQQIHRVLAPVDLTSASVHQVKVAAGLASALSTPLIVAHVMEPVFVPATVRLVLPGSEATRREEMEERLAAIVTSVPSTATIETLVVSGEPSEEIVRLAETRDARVIVMGLHSSGLLGPRMGSVTYRVLCLTRALVLALPPLPDAAGTAAHSSGLTGVVV